MGFSSRFLNNLNASTPVAASSADLPGVVGDNLTEDLLYAIWKQVGGGSGSGSENVFHSQNVTNTSTVTAGKKSIVFTCDSTFTGTVNGVPRVANTIITVHASPGDTLPAIPYSVTTGSINIDTLE